jgi:hypothetical protein
MKERHLNAGHAFSEMYLVRRYRWSSAKLPQMPLADTTGADASMFDACYRNYPGSGILANTCTDKKTNWRDQLTTVSSRCLREYPLHRSVQNSVEDNS